MANPGGIGGGDAAAVKVVHPGVRLASIAVAPLVCLGLWIWLSADAEAVIGGWGVPPAVKVAASLISMVACGVVASRVSALVGAWVVRRAGLDTDGPQAFEEVARPRGPV